ncbi:MAG TPA: SIS domain-containing protein, partial [Planctomycetota bacterium]|nr:SIS domain-containing protein [Planctomycetota bacterium]
RADGVRHAPGDEVRVARLHRDAVEHAFERGDVLDGIRALSLNAHAGLVSAIANDNDPDLVFAQQVHVVAGPADVLIALSTSGGSANVLRAAEVGRERGCRVIALTGGRDCALGRLADCWLRAPALETYRVQEQHLPLYHALCYLAEQELFAPAATAA